MQNSMNRNRSNRALPHATGGHLYVSLLASPKNEVIHVFKRRTRKGMHSPPNQDATPQSIFGYAIDRMAIYSAVDRKVSSLARWKDGRRAAAAWNPDSGVADAAGMVPGS